MTMISDAAKLIRTAADAGFLVYTEDGRLFAEPLTDRELPAELRAALKAHKPELIAHLEWVRDVADPLVLETSRRLAAVYPGGVDFDSDDWRRWDRRIHEAVEAGRTGTLRAVLADYELWAVERCIRGEA